MYFKNTNRYFKNVRHVLIFQDLYFSFDRKFKFLFIQKINIVKLLALMISADPEGSTFLHGVL